MSNGLPDISLEVSFFFVNALHLNQHFFCLVGTLSCLPGLNQYLAEDILYQSISLTPGNSE